MRSENVCRWLIEPLKKLPREHGTDIAQCDSGTILDMDASGGVAECFHCDWKCDVSTEPVLHPLLKQSWVDWVARQ